MAEMSKNNAPNDVSSLRGWAVLAGTRELELLLNKTAASSQVARVILSSGRRAIRS